MVFLCVSPCTLRLRVPFLYFRLFHLLVLAAFTRTRRSYQNTLLIPVSSRFPRIVK